MDKGVNEIDVFAEMAVFDDDRDWKSAFINTAETHADTCRDLWACQEALSAMTHDRNQWRIIAVWACVVQLSILVAYYVQ
jgi:hypothetical protein